MFKVILETANQITWIEIINNKQFNCINQNEF